MFQLFFYHKIFQFESDVVDATENLIPHERNHSIGIGCSWARPFFCFLSVPQALLEMHTAGPLHTSCVRETMSRLRGCFWGPASCPLRGPRCLPEEKRSHSIWLLSLSLSFSLFFPFNCVSFFFKNSLHLQFKNCLLLNWFECCSVLELYEWRSIDTWRVMQKKIRRRESDIRGKRWWRPNSSDDSSLGGPSLGGGFPSRDSGNRPECSRQPGYLFF